MRATFAAAQAVAGVFDLQPSEYLYAVERTAPITSIAEQEARLGLGREVAENVRRSQLRLMDKHIGYGRINMQLVRTRW